MVGESLKSIQFNMVMSEHKFKQNCGKGCNFYNPRKYFEECYIAIVRNSLKQQQNVLCTAIRKKFVGMVLFLKFFVQIQ